MKHQIGKKLILWLAALTLLVTSCATAFASPGDRTLKHVSSVNFDTYDSNELVYRSGDGFCVITSDDTGRYLLKYADTESEPEKYVLEENNRDSWDEEEEDGAAAEEQVTGESAETAEPDAEKAEEEKPETDAEPTADAEAESEGQPAVEGLLNWDDIDWSDEALNSEDMPEGFMDGEMYEYVPEPYVNTWIGWNGELYGIGVTETWDDEIQQSHVEGVKLQRIRFEDGKVIKEDTEYPDWDHEILIEALGMDGYFYLNDVVVSGDLLMTLSWGMDGQKIVTVNLKTGSVSSIDTVENTIAFTAGPDDTLILASYDYMTQKNTIIRKSLADGKDEVLAEFEKGTQSMGLGYEKDTDTLYMVMNGELWKAPLADAANAVAVNDCPLADCSIVPMGNGFVLLWNRNNILLRNTDPAVRGTIALHVEDNIGYNDTMAETVFTLSEKRGDLSVIVSQRYDWRDSSTVLQDMLNKDGRTDIYVLPYDGSNFNALKNRGYLADLGDNAEIAEYVNRMYPYIQDALKVDGKIIAVPIALNGNTFGISYNAWKKIGGTEEELPKTWDQFLDWMEKLPERLEGTDISICNDTYAASSLPGMFMDVVMHQHQMKMESKGEEVAFNTPEMRKLVERIYNMDFKSLGMKSWEDEDNTGGYISYDDSAIISSYITPPMGEQYSGGGYPIALSLTEDEEPIVPVQIYVACVNPFSEHAKEAKEFLALAMENLQLIAEYTFFADKTEPLRYSSYEEDRKRTEKYLEEAKKYRDEAEEGEEKTYAEDSVKMWEEQLERMEDYSWQMNPETIERYQKILPACRVLDHDFLQEIQSTVSEQDEQLMKEYTGDNMDIEKILSFYDQKIQMIRMEGK